MANNIIKIRVLKDLVEASREMIQQKNDQLSEEIRTVVRKIQIIKI